MVRSGLINGRKYFSQLSFRSCEVQVTSLIATCPSGDILSQMETHLCIGSEFAPNLKPLEMKIKLNENLNYFMLYDFLKSIEVISVCQLAWFVPLGIICTHLVSFHGLTFYHCSLLWLIPFPNVFPHITPLKNDNIFTESHNFVNLFVRKH